MAARKSKKTKVRRANNRRVKQVQGLTDTEIQVIKARIAAIHAALDLDRDTGPEWFDGFIRSGLYTRLRTLVRSLHHALPPRVFFPESVQSVRLAASTGRVSANSGENQSASPSAVGGGLPENARAGLPDGFSVTPTYSDENVSGHGERVYQFDARQPVRSSERSGGEREVQTDSERCDLPGGHTMGNCPLCED